MGVVGLPLPTAIAHLDAAFRRLKDLIDPAFGIVGPERERAHARAQQQQQAQDGREERGQDNDDHDHDHDKQPQAEASTLHHNGNNDIIDKRRRSATKLRNHVNSADVYLTFFQLVVDVKWDRIAPEKLRGISAGTVAAVVGAGAEVVDALESALCRLAELYATEADLILGGNDGDGTKAWEEEEAEREKLRCRRYEIRKELGDLVGGLDCFKTELGRLRLALETFSEEAEEAMKAVEMSAIEILARNSELSRAIRSIYPDPELSPESPSCHDNPYCGAGSVEPSLAMQSTSAPGPSLQDQCRRRGSIIYLDDADPELDSDSAGPPTPTSSASSSSVGLWGHEQQKPKLKININTTQRAFRHGPLTLDDLASPTELVVPIPARLAGSPEIADEAFPFNYHNAHALELPITFHVSADDNTSHSPTILVTPSALSNTTTCPPFLNQFDFTSSSSPFDQPDLTPADMLHHLQTAISNSCYAHALRFWLNADDSSNLNSQRNPNPPHHATERARLRDLSACELRHLCADLCDAVKVHTSSYLFRSPHENNNHRQAHMIKPSFISQDRRAGVIINPIPLGPHEGVAPDPSEVDRFGLQRAIGRHKLARMSAGVFVWFVDSVFAELRRRVTEEGRVPGGED